eukprot:gene17278-20562_t
MASTLTEICSEQHASRSEIVKRPVVAPPPPIQEDPDPRSTGVRRETVEALREVELEKYRRWEERKSAKLAEAQQSEMERERQRHLELMEAAREERIQRRANRMSDRVQMLEKGGVSSIFLDRKNPCELPVASKPIHPFQTAAERRRDCIDKCSHIDHEEALTKLMKAKKINTRTARS